MSCDQGNSGGNAGANDGTGDSADSEEQEESSSTLNLNSDKLEGNDLENFRQQWQRELQISPKHEETEKVKSEGKGNGEDDIEARAGALYVKGVEHEGLGKVYDAVYFYKRAEQLVPNIELKYTEILETSPRVHHETFGTNNDQLTVDLLPGSDSNECEESGGELMVDSSLDVDSNIIEDDVILYHIKEVIADTMSVKSVSEVDILEFEETEYQLTIYFSSEDDLSENEDAEDYTGTLNLPEDINSDDQDLSVDLLLQIQRKIGRNHSVCVPEYEQKSTHISALPTEIILYILRWIVSSNLDVRSLELCAQVSRGFYICCRDVKIWKNICLNVWGICCGRQPDPYQSWREMYIKRARLNFNGCYISKTSYFRQGENSFQDQFYRPCHLVEYYRYLRFFPDGYVLMLTTPDEPVQSVAHLRSRMPKVSGVLSGHYRLWKNTVTMLLQRHDIKNPFITYRRVKRKEISDGTERTYKLDMKINNHHSRKYVQLSWIGYSVLMRNRNGLETSSPFEMIANRFPPFWFSRVKSYTSVAESPLE